MLTILAFACPPLAVLATEGRSRAVSNLGWTLFFYVPGLLDAWTSVERHEVARRYESVAQFLDA